jgi:hypothetical protein
LRCIFFQMLKMCLARPSTSAAMPASASAARILRLASSMNRSRPVRFSSSRRAMRW